MPSYIPTGDVSYIKPQYAMSSLNRNMIFPGVPQSLPQIIAPPQLPQIAAPPQLPLLPAPPVNFNFDGSFGRMLENMMMPREYGYKSQSYAAEQIDDDVMDALPPPQQDKYMENKIAPQIEEQMKDITFDNEDDKLKSYKQAVSNKTAKEWGTKHANKLQPYDIKYKDNEYYKSNYVSRLQDIMTQDTMKTRGGTKTNTIESKEKAKDLLKAMGIKPAIKIAVPEYIPPAAQPEVAPPATPPRPNRQAQVVKSPAPAPPKPTPPPPPPPPKAAPPKAAPPPPPPPKEGKGPSPPGRTAAGSSPWAAAAPECPAKYACFRGPRRRRHARRKHGQQSVY